MAILKIPGQNLLIHQFGIKPLAQDFDFFEIILAEGKKIDTVVILIDQAPAFGGQLIETGRFQLAQEGAFLNPLQAVLLAGFGDPVADFIIPDVVKNPDQNRHYVPANEDSASHHRARKGHTGEGACAPSMHQVTVL